MPQPKGIRTRNTPDWFALFLSQAGYGNSNLPISDFAAISLYNNASDGSFLFVWAMQVVFGNSDFAYVAFQNEPPGTQVNAGTRVNPQVGAPPGAVYLATQSGSAFSFPFVGVSGAFGTPPITGAFPQYVIPPGQSLVLFADFAGPVAAANWWYIPAIDPKGYTAR